MKDFISDWLTKNRVIVSDEQLLNENNIERRTRLARLIILFALISNSFTTIFFGALYFWLPTSGLLIVTILMTFMSILYATAWWLLKKNYFSLVCWLQFFLMFVNITAVIILFGTDYPSAAAYIMVIMVARLLLNRRSVYFVVLLTILSSFLLPIAEKSLNLFTPQLKLDSQTQLWLSSSLWALIILSAGMLMILTLNSFERISLLSNRQNQKLQKTMIAFKERQEVGQNFTELVAVTTNQLNATANKQSVGSQQQAAAITEVSTSLTELTQTAETIARTARNVAAAMDGMVSGAAIVQETTVRASQVSEQGRLAASHTITTSQQVGTLYETLVRTLLSLSQRAENIRLMLDLIDSVADETHLLALNAAIEAVGAGTSGLRFGVVAQEVKQLADRTREAGSEVRELVLQIENSVAQAVMTAESGNKVAMEAISTAFSSNTVISQLAEVVEKAAAESRTIVGQVNIVLQLSEEIELATRQQQSAGEQILQTLKDVTNVAYQNASDSQQITVTVRELENLSVNLKTVLVSVN